ncbi:MAG: CO dehydrogenase/acetyl-CoA synthase subunit delta [Candidatus Hodarchaeales archaeon]|jgi:acetyl-CoA decarbonylase/synthase complex subunit delta
MTDEEQVKKLLKLLEQVESIELTDLSLYGEELAIELTPQALVQMAPRLAQQVVGVMPIALPTSLSSGTFEKTPETFIGEVVTVELGATRANGGSRDVVKILGGHKNLPFHDLNTPRPTVTFDCFDMAISLPKPIRKEFGEVMNDPGEWAKKAVKLGADAITIHLVSTDPYIKDTSAKEAAKAVEEVLQAVKVPLVIGGSGNPEKDPDVLVKAAEVASGERCLLASANLSYGDKANERIVKAAIEHNHNVLSFTQIDINNQEKLNRMLLKFGLPRDHLVQDPTTASLGYGFEYSLSIYERIKIAGLKGNKNLAFPCSSGTTNAWGAREAHRSEKKEKHWGPRYLRGPLWEATTAITLAIAGADLFMMLHPLSVATFKEIVDTIINPPSSTPPSNYLDWVNNLF